MKHPLLNQKYTLHYLFEIAIIVVGVMVSLMIDEWRHDLAEEEREIKILTEIQQDLAADTTTINFQIFGYKQTIKSYNSLLAGKEMANYKSGLVIDMLMSYQKLQVRNNGYLKLKESVSLIDNDTILNIIIQQYNVMYSNIAEWNYVDKQFVLERMIPYLEENAPYDTGGTEFIPFSSVTINALKNKSHFKNLIKTNKMFKRGGLHAYMGNLYNIRKVLKRIDAYIVSKQ